MNATDDEGRGNRIPLDPRFLDHLESLWKQVKAGTFPATFGTKYSLAGFGKLLAEKTGRETAWSDASLTRYFSGEQVTDQLTRALCLFFDVDYPVISAASPEEARWFAIGRRLRELRPEVFAATLERLDQAVEQAEAARESELKLQSTLQTLQADSVVQGKSEPRSKVANDVGTDPGGRPRRLDRDR